MNKIDLCLSIATAAHAGQIDKNGEAYILHPLAVGLMGATDEERMAGFLHDVVEDNPEWTFSRLEQEGVPKGVLAALKLLTHSHGEDYQSYLQRIIDSRNPIALRVKHNDLTHNLSRAHSNDYFRQKYQPALARIKAALAELSRVELYEPAAGVEVAIFACGCFWGVQHQFMQQKGVVRTFAGYTGGSERIPAYEDVRAQLTGHVEAVAVEYNPAQTDYQSLCQLFFEIHDPAQTDGQGPDKGAQYLSTIFYRNEAQRATAEQVIADLRSRHHVVNTRLLPATDFWKAEQLHQQYYSNTGGQPYCHIRQRKF